MHPEGNNKPFKPYTVKIIKDIVYGVGEVRDPLKNSLKIRDLKLDIYQPLISGTKPLPAIVLAFGGAFHRGSKEDDTFGVPPNQNNFISWYCHELAGRGYICCSIDYRLVIEDPTPGNTLVVSQPENIPRSRVDTVREIMGLARASNDTLWRGIEAASDDMALAVRYLKNHADKWRIDPKKIAIGGFSAGARTAINVALGEKEPVIAVVLLSGYIHTVDLKWHTASITDFPSFLFINSENDLDYILHNKSVTLEHLRQLGAHCESVEVPESTHFYAAQAPAVHDRNGLTNVEEAIAQFLSDVFTNPADRDKQIKSQPKATSR